MAEKAQIWFQESDVLSVIFRKSTTYAPWDASYDVHIILPHGTVELDYNPPFFGVTPIANARYSEGVRVTFNLGYPELGS
jgi:hypothetical protein